MRKSLLIGCVFCLSAFTTTTTTTMPTPMPYQAPTTTHVPTTMAPSTPMPSVHTPTTTSMPTVHGTIMPSTSTVHTVPNTMPTVHQQIPASPGVPTTTVHTPPAEVPAAMVHQQAATAAPTLTQTLHPQAPPTTVHQQASVGHVADLYSVMPAGKQQDNTIYIPGFGAYHPGNDQDTIRLNAWQNAGAPGYTGAAFTDANGNPIAPTVTGAPGTGRQAGGPGVGFTKGVTDPSSSGSSNGAPGAHPPLGSPAAQPVTGTYENGRVQAPSGYHLNSAGIKSIENINNAALQGYGSKWADQQIQQIVSNPGYWVNDMDGFYTRSPGVPAAQQETPPRVHQDVTIEPGTVPPSLNFEERPNNVEHNQIIGTIYHFSDGTLVRQPNGVFYAKDKNGNFIDPNTFHSSYKRQ
jgi:hypothetical protein